MVVDIQVRMVYQVPLVAVLLGTMNHTLAAQEILLLQVHLKETQVEMQLVHLLDNLVVEVVEQQLLVVIV